ncbi:hypothetical protein J1614_008056 [Plenodomus biglobosus]|nr:hypothetical protein J1614_008056 [Plenodomus biglobosus]
MVLKGPQSSKRDKSRCAFPNKWEEGLGGAKASLLHDRFTVVPIHVYFSDLHVLCHKDIGVVSCFFHSFVGGGIDVAGLIVFALLIMYRLLAPYVLPIF